MVHLRNALRHLLFSILLIGVYFIYKQKPYTIRAWSDTTAIIGLCYLSLGLFRLTRHLGFFDSSIYGTKRLWEIITVPQRASTPRSKYGTFVAYKEQNVYTQPYISLLLTAIFLLVFALVTALCSR